MTVENSVKVTVPRTLELEPRSAIRISADSLWRGYLNRVENIRLSMLLEALEKISAWKARSAADMSEAWENHSIRSGWFLGCGAQSCATLQDREGDVKKLKVHRKFWEFSHVYA